MRFVLILLLLSSCGRGLTPGETQLARAIHGDALDPALVRLIDGAPTKAVTFRRPARPRTTCREKILPPAPAGIVTSKPAAIALYNRVFFDTDWYAPDFLPDAPKQINLVAAMLLAHELTHVWQWQNRARTGYSPLRAAQEHEASDDPYLFALHHGPRLEDFGFEQQGAIVEEYLCCAVLAPHAARTARLHAMLAQSMPIAPISSLEYDQVLVPWRGVKVQGICD